VAWGWGLNAEGCTSRRCRRRSRDALALGVLTRQQERLDQFTLAADSHSRESFVPFPVRHVRFGVEPLRKEFESRRLNLTALDTIEEVLEQRGRNVLAPDLRHDAASDSVEAACETFLDTSRLDGIGRHGQLFCEQAELVRTETITFASSALSSAVSSATSSPVGLRATTLLPISACRTNQWYTASALLITSVRFDRVSSAI